MTERYARITDEARRSVGRALNRVDFDSRLRQSAEKPEPQVAEIAGKSLPFNGKIGTPSGIRTRDLYLERVAS